MMDTTASSFDGERFQSGSFAVVNPDLFDHKLPLGNELFPELAKAVFDLEVQLSKLSSPPGLANGTIRADGERPPSSHCAVNRNAEFTPHVDSGRGRGQSVSMIVGLGDYNGGTIFVEGQDYDIRYNPLEFDGWKQRHWTAPFAGERYSLVWFTPAGNDDENDMTVDDDESGSTSNTTPEERRAQALIREHHQQLPSYPPLKYRPGSTDALAINEIFDTDKGCAYELNNHVWGEFGSPPRDFSPKGHVCVLDVGAHIGAFSQFALASGCQKVIAYEPEPANAELLAFNLQPIEGKATDVVIHVAAVAQGESGHKTLVHARSRNDGTLNTWRHALEDYSQYTDKATKLPSPSQEGTLSRTRVLTVPFFGNALVPGVTFVKMDCEGAEMDILLSEEAGLASSWLDVTHFVCEWSFTKEKRVHVFHKAMRNLKAAGFDVWYDGQGAWWDAATDPDTMWPFHSDLVVFALRSG